MPSFVRADLISATVRFAFLGILNYKGLEKSIEKETAPQLAPGWQTKD